MSIVHSLSADAVLVDCQIVKQRKKEIQSLSPADLGKVLGERALDPFLIDTPLSILTYPDPNAGVQRGGVRNTGRKRKAVEDKRFWKIGRSVDGKIPRMTRGMEIRRQLEAHSFFKPHDLQTHLQRERFSTHEIEAVLFAKTIVGAAKRTVANELKMSLASVHTYYSSYVKCKKLALRSSNSS